MSLKKAFTLIELLVVLAIMGVLAGAIIYSTNNARIRGRDQVRKEDLKTINSALVSYWADNRLFPPSSGTQRDFASDVGGTNWIPDINQFIEKVPKDPLQALKGSVAATQTFKTKIATTEGGSPLRRIDDGKRVSDPGANQFQNDVTDEPIGHPFICDETRNVFMLFRNIPLTGTNASGVTIKFDPRNDGGPGDDGANSTDPSLIKTRFYGELSLNPSPINSNSDWLSRPKTTAYVDWNSIPKWYPSPTASQLTSPDLSPIINEIVSQPGWQPGNNILIFWEDNGTNPGSGSFCAGRVAVSSDGEKIGLGNAPEITIDYDNSAPPPPPPPPPPSSVDRGACDNKKGIYCLRVSDNRKAYVLWTQLENLSDPSLAAANSAVCKASDPDFSTESSNTSPYKGLGKPIGSSLNYCIKSAN